MRPQTLAMYQDRVIAALSVLKDGLSRCELQKLIRANCRSTTAALAALREDGVAEYVPRYAGLPTRVWRLTGRERRPVVIPADTRPKRVPKKPHLVRPPRVRPPLEASLQNPVWRTRWPRTDPARELEVLVTAGADYVYITHWQRFRDEFIPLKGALRLKKAEAEQLHDALGVALEYAR